MNMEYKAYTLNNYKDIPQIAFLDEEQIFDIEVVGRVFPFKTNNYIVDQLIQWEDVPYDPMFILNFPQREMLMPVHYDEVATLLRKGAGEGAVERTVNRIRMQLNPHPAGQIEHNVPTYQGEVLYGMQHKYRETILFFPKAGQTCHAYCSFCFRWPQFTNMSGLRFAMQEVELLTDYIRAHREVTDVLITGGDPLVMSTKRFREYIIPLLKADIPHLNSLRIGTKSLSYWPYRFVTDDDAAGLLDIFREVVRSGRHLAFMAHFNHPRELHSGIVREAIARIRGTGAEIRTQSPILHNINDDQSLWADMWREQVNLGCIPYYMFVVRNTGAQHYFGVPLVRAWEIFRDAFSQVSGLARSVRGPSMSAMPGKVQVLGVSEIMGRRVIALTMLQGRNADWVLRPFFADYDERAMWLDDLKPAFDAEAFFFEEEFLFVE